MPVETLVIVPTSRGVSCGVKASRAWLDRGEGAVEDALQAFRRSVHGSSFGLRFVGFSAALASGSAFSFSSSPTPFSSDAR